MKGSFDKVLEPHMACRPLEPDNYKTTIANLRAANDEMRRVLDDKDLTLAMVIKEIRRLRDEIRELMLIHSKPNRK